MATDPVPSRTSPADRGSSRSFDRREPSSAPRTVGDLDYAGAIAVLTVTNVEAIATPNAGDHCVRTRGAIRVEIALLIEIKGHAVAASRHASFLPAWRSPDNGRFRSIADGTH